jgi:hypothetical protein
MPPLQLTDAEMSVLRRLAEPIDHNAGLSSSRRSRPSSRRAARRARSAKAPCTASLGRCSGSFSTRPSFRTRQGARGPDLTNPREHFGDRAGFARDLGEGFGGESRFCNSQTYYFKLKPV